MADKPEISDSLENYLEAIYRIVSEHQVARPKDIARNMQVSNSSVTGALRSLADKNLVNYEPFELITLTPQGRAIAKGVSRRHRVLHMFLREILGIEEAEADDVACKMEHSLSATALHRLSCFLDFLETCPMGGVAWVEGFGFSQGKCLGEVEKCLDQARTRTTLQDEYASAQGEEGDEH
jgi:DtxR family Mn-dependent transcriptional regulator